MALPPDPVRIRGSAPGQKTAGTRDAYELFAFSKTEAMEGTELRRSRLPLERVGPAVEWAISRGCDTVLVEADDAEPFPLGAVHHVCADASCPGGC